MAIAGEFGEAAARAARAMVDRRGLDVFPKSMPTVPLWADPASLPLTISSRRDIAPYGGIEIVKEPCDAASLAEFAWGLFENRANAGYPAKNLGWAFDTLLWFGDASTAQRLAPLVRAWPGEGGSSRAAVGPDVLIATGGEAGLREVYDISQRSSFTALRADASQRVAEVAVARGLSSDQLEDQLVLDLGAGPDATLSLDFGAPVPAGRRTSVRADRAGTRVSASGPVLRRTAADGRLPRAAPESRLERDAVERRTDCGDGTAAGAGSGPAIGFGYRLSAVRKSACPSLRIRGRMAT